MGFFDKFNKNKKQEAAKKAELETVIKKMDINDIERIYGLMESEQKIVAIKEIMEATGLGLADAKQIADDYRVFLKI